MNLPFTMAGRIEDCIQLTYRTPAESVVEFLPDGLELVTRGPWAFWNVMACRVDRLRPAGVPGLVGVRYHHVAYRLRVQAMTERAEVVQGLYFVRSDVDARVVSMLGSPFTDLRPQPAAITHQADDCGVKVESRQAHGGKADLFIDASHAPSALTPGSCFPTTEDARQFCRYTPNGLAVVERGGQRLLRVSRVDRNDHTWCETPLVLHEAKLGYFESIGQDEHARLEWASRLGPMDYKWRVGETTPLLLQHKNSAPLIRTICSETA